MHPSPRPRLALRLEQLETRCVLSGYAPTNAEQVFLERLNDARANPAAYGASIGVDLSGVAARPPLAINPLVVEAAHLHSQDMSDQNYFSHYTPQGLGPGERLTNAGFGWTYWGESIAAMFPTPETALAGLITDAGVPTLEHRKHLLGMEDLYAVQNQVGFGVVQGGAGTYVNYYTVDTGLGYDTRPFITGVVYADGNGNGRYDAGEGLGGVTVNVPGVGATTTWASGGYSIQVYPGTYAVTASGGGLNAPVTQTVTVGAGNCRLNVNALGTAGDPHPVQTVTDAAGRTVFFVLGLDNQVYLQKYDAWGNLVAGYSLAAPGQVKNFVAGRDGAGNPELFVIGLNDRVYALRFDGNSNPAGGYFFTAEGAVKTVAAGRDASNRPVLFVTGLDDQVWTQRFDWNGYSLGPYFLAAYGKVSQAAVGRDAPGNPELFVIQTDGQVYGLKFNASDYPVGGYFLAAAGKVKSVQAGHDGQDRPELFAVGLDNQVYGLKCDPWGTPLTGWFLTAPGQVKTASVGNGAGGQPLLFVIGLNDNVYVLKMDTWGTPLGGYAPAAPGMVKTLSAARNGSGNPELFCVGLDFQVWGQKFDGSGNSVAGYFLTQSGYVK
jgi:uncharacterized protein YkwD